MNKIKEKIVLWMFERYFRYFNYPFERSDEYIQGLTDTERFRYLQGAYEWTQSKAYKTETQEIIRTMYRDMANKAQNNIEFTGYRLALVMFKRYDQRLLHLSEAYNQEKKITEVNELLN